MERDLEEKVKENPSTRLFAPLADHYKKRGQIDKAVKTLIRGLSFHPSYTSARVLLARCYEDQGEWEKAREAWQDVLNVDSSNLVALKGMGEICRLFGEFEESRRWFQVYLDEFPDDEIVREKLNGLDRDLANQSDHGEEEEDSRVKTTPEHKFGQSLDLNKSDGEVTDPSTEAEGDLEESYEEEESMETITLAEIYAQQGFYERAIGIFRRLLSQEPDNPQIVDRINELKEKMGQESDKGTSAEKEPNGYISTTETVDPGYGSGEEEKDPPEEVDGSIEPININSATTRELEAIPGVGPVIARKIVLERERNGQFESVDDLDRVPSMGERIIDRVIPYLKFETIVVDIPSEPPPVVEEEIRGEDMDNDPAEDIVEDLDRSEKSDEGENFDLEFEEFRKWLKNLRK